MVARRLVFAAVVLWLASLFLSAVVLEHGAIRGAVVLLFGWAGTLAWFANPLFVWAGWRIARGLSARLLAWMTVAVAMVGFGATEVPGGFLEPPSPIHGFGWGFVAWLLAMVMMLAAAYAPRSPITSGDLPPARALRIRYLFLAGLATALVWTYVDRGKRLTQADAARATAWSRVDPCDASPPRVESRPLPPMQAVELIAEPAKKPLYDRPGLLHLEAAHVFSVRHLLAWGIPVVRWQDRDYRYVERGVDRFVVSEPATRPVGARLLASATADGALIDARLVAEPDGATLFERAWRRTVVRTICPPLQVSPFGGDKRAQAGEPQTLVQLALGVEFVDLMGRHDVPQEGGRPLDATVRSIARGDAAPTASNCPADTRLEPLAPGSRSFHVGQVRLHHGGRIFEPITFAPTAVVCSGDGGIVLLASRGDASGARLHVQKRSPDDFTLLWERHASIASPELIRSRTNLFDLAMAEERTDSVRLVLVRRDTHYRYDVDIPDRR